MPFEKTSEISYVHKPNLANVRGRGFAVFNTDSLSLRSKISGQRYESKKNNEYRVAVVGDSYTFGEGVRRTEDTYCQVLEDMLNERQTRKQIRVFNYGVSAYNVKSMADTLDYRVFKEVQPDLVIMSIIESDFDLSRTGTVDRWGYTMDKKLSGMISKNSVFKRILRNVRLTYLLRDLRYFLTHRVSKDMAKASEYNMPDSYIYVEKFADIAKEHNVPHLVVLLPRFSKGYEKFTNKLIEDRINYLDAGFIEDEFSPKVFKASKFDEHPSATVHRRIAEVLADHILTHDLIQ